MSKTVILNGVSSSGKSTLAQALQETLEGHWLHFKMDDFWNMLPKGVEANSTNFPYMKIAMALSVAALLDTGHDVVVDIVCASPDQTILPEFIKRLNPHNVHEVFTVAVTADLSVIEAREAKRKDRRKGLARSQYDLVHYDGQYDLMVDTTNQTPKAIAKQISKQFI